MPVNLRHWFAVLLLVTSVLLGGCSGDQPTSAVEVPTRDLETPLGTIAVPQHPQRAVVLGNQALEAALALGITPVGAAPDSLAGNVGQFPDYLAPEAIADVTYIGDEEQPNLEALLRLHPDLILGIQSVHERIYPQLSQIAPTALFALYTPHRIPWQNAFLAYADALGERDRADEVVARYNRRLQALQTQLGEERSQLQISVVRFLPGQLRMYLKDCYIGDILDDLGVSRPASQTQERFAEPLSLERLTEADGDVLFVIQTEPDNSLYQQFSQHPLWNQLQAVRNRRVYPVEPYWLGGGEIAAELVLDDLFRSLAASPDDL